MSVEFTQRQKIFYEKLIHFIFFLFSERKCVCNKNINARIVTMIKFSSTSSLNLNSYKALFIISHLPILMTLELRRLHGVLTPRAYKYMIMYLELNKLVFRCYSHFKNLRQH